MGLIAALHNFPSMPWHTVDGLLCSSLGLSGLLFWLERKTILPLFFCGLFSSAAVLCKQSFFLVPIFHVLVFVGVTVTSEKKNHTAKASIAMLVGLLLLPLSYILHLYFAGGLSDANQQLAAVSNGSSAFRAGIGPYLNRGSFVSFLLGSLAFKFVRGPRRTSAGFGILVLIFLINFPTSGWALSYKIFMMMAGIVTTSLSDQIWGKRSQLHGKSPLIVYALGGLIISWSTQISWGYLIPVLGFGLLIPSAVFLILDNSLAETKINHDLGTACLMLAVLLSGGYWPNASHPYREVDRANQTRNLSEIYAEYGPKLMTSAAHFEYHRGLKDILARATRSSPLARIVAFPVPPLFYILNSLRNPTSIDWWLPAEYVGNEARLVAELRQPKIVILLETRNSDCFALLGSGAIDSEIRTFSVLERNDQFCAVERVSAGKLER
jgi:hypothetical protein